MTVSVNNITKYYGSAAAVKDVSFEVNTGEVVGFLGPNGAGKTTTMKIITCFMPPTSGIVTVNGYSIFDNPREVRSKIGYLPESNPLYPDMSVVEFLDYSGRMQGMKSNSLVARIDEMIDMTGLGNMRHKDIFELSKGYKQRVGLAQAMLHDPEVLILDEPTSGLDPNQIIEIRKLIRKMGENKTVILSTHILTEVQAVCDRVLIINKGEIAADGNIDQLRDDFAGAETVNLEIKANTNISTDEIAGQLRISDEVISSELIETLNGSYKFRVKSPKGTDIRTEIFQKIVEKNWILLGMDRKVSSLEDLFRSLTNDKKD